MVKNNTISQFQIRHIFYESFLSYISLIHKFKMFVKGYKSQESGGGHPTAILLNSEVAQLRHSRLLSQSSMGSNGAYRTDSSRVISCKLRPSGSSVVFEKKKH